MSTPVRPVDQHRHGAAFVAALVAGWLLIAFGVRAALDDAADSNPDALVVQVVLLHLGHDLLIAPVAIGVGAVIGKLVPAVARGPVRTAIAATALFVLFSYPLVRRWGRRPTNPSTLPLEYGRNLAIILAVVWSLAIVVVVRRVVAASRSARRTGATRSTEAGAIALQAALVTKW